MLVRCVVACVFGFNGLRLTASNTAYKSFDRWVLFAVILLSIRGCTVGLYFGKFCMFCLLSAVYGAHWLALLMVFVSWFESAWVLRQFIVGRVSSALNTAFSLELGTGGRVFRRFMLAGLHSGVFCCCVAALLQFYCLRGLYGTLLLF